MVAFCSPEAEGERYAAMSSHSCLNNLESDWIKPPHRGTVILGDRGLTIKGGVYTKEKYPICGGRFRRIADNLLYVTHQTRPKKVFVQFYSPEIKKYVQLYSESRGILFTSYEQADRILTKIRAEVDAGAFAPSRYIPQKLKPLQFKNWSARWLENRETEAWKKIIFPSYTKCMSSDLFGHFCSR
jgi:hypothetical protein